MIKHCFHAAISMSLGAVGLLGAPLNLEGEWEIAPMPGVAWSAEAMPAATTAWQRVHLPNHLWAEDKALAAQCAEAPGVWACRTFVLTPEQTTHDSALRWEQIKWEFVARLNGTAVGASQWYAPGSLALPRGVLRAGTNELLLSVREWNSLPRSMAANEVLLPVGAARYGWGRKTGGVLAPVELELYDGVRIRSIAVRPDLERMTAVVNVRLEPVAGVVRQVDVSVAVVDAAGKTAGNASIAVACTGASMAVVAVPLPNASLWTPATPVLCTARVRLSGAGIADERAVKFGMRTFGVRGGHFALNGARHQLRGANLLAEWNWSADNFTDRDGCLTRYLTETARRMHVGTFRTHTLPPAHRVADICDAHGTLLIAEMPLTYNGSDYRFSAAEEAQYRSNAVAMCSAWVEELANHPSIIMWVSSNEPVDADDNDQYGWDIGTLIPAMKSVDPTRPVLRAGAESPEVQDTHCYAGYWNGAAGEFEAFARWRAETRDPRRPIMNSEYIEGAPPQRRFLWSGAEDDTPAWDMIYAMVGMEQTEALRRLGYDGILPYMFSGWARGAWRADAPTPMFAALRSALAPVAVSLNLADRNFAAGATVRVPVHVMSDLNEAVAARLVCYVRTNDPAFALDQQAYANATRVAVLDVRVPAQGSVVTNVAFPLPAMEGNCWLAAVLQPEGGATVMSQRPLHVLDPMRVAGVLSGMVARVIGADAATRAALTRYGLTMRDYASFGPVESEVDLVIVCEYGLPGTPEESQVKWLNKYLTDGGTVLILGRNGLHAAYTRYFHFPTLPNGMQVEYDAQPHRCSSVFPSPLNPTPALWRGLSNEHLVRWNGLRNAVCMECLNADWLDAAPPARQTAQGPQPGAGAIVVEGEAPLQSTFIVDWSDRMFTVKGEDGGLQPKQYRAWRGGRAGLLCTRTAAAPAYAASYELRAEGAAGQHVLWVFEQMREWASPFDWRIDDGTWHSVPRSTKMMNLVRTEEGGPTFAWTRLGVVDLTPGPHRLDIRVTAPRADGLYLLSFDCLMFAPLLGETLAISGDRAPLLARVPVGKGNLYVTTLLFTDRIAKCSPCYDPAAERLFVNLLKTACPPDARRPGMHSGNE